MVFFKYIYVFPVTTLPREAVTNCTLVSAKQNQKTQKITGKIKLAYVHKYTFSFVFELHDHREYKIFTGIPPAAQRTVSSDSSDSFAEALIQKNKEPFLRR